MLFCAPEYQDAVTQSLEGDGLRRMAFHFEHSGARVLMNAGLRLNGTEPQGGRLYAPTGQAMPLQTGRRQTTSSQPPLQD